MMHRLGSKRPRDEHFGGGVGGMSPGHGGAVARAHVPPRAAAAAGAVASAPRGRRLRTGDGRRAGGARASLARLPMQVLRGVASYLDVAEHASLLATWNRRVVEAMRCPTAWPPVLRLTERTYRVAGVRRDDAMSLVRLLGGRVGRLHLGFVLYARGETGDVELMDGRTEPGVLVAELCGGHLRELAMHECDMSGEDARVLSRSCPRLESVRLSTDAEASTELEMLEWHTAVAQALKHRWGPTLRDIRLTCEKGPRGRARARVGNGGVVVGGGAAPGGVDGAAGGADAGAGGCGNSGSAPVLLAAVAMHCSRLRSLHARLDESGSSPETWRMLGRRCPGLLRLRLHGLEGDDEVCALAGGVLRRLEELELVNPLELSDRSVRALASPTPPAAPFPLRRLVLDVVDEGEPGITDAGLSALAAAPPPALAELCLRGLKQVTDRGTAGLVAALPRLAALRLGAGTAAGPLALGAAAARCPLLRRLRVEEPPASAGLTNASVEAAARAMPALEELALHLAPGCTLAACLPAAVRHCRRLRVLSLRLRSGEWGADAGAGAWTCPALRELSLGGGDDGGPAAALPADVLPALASACPGLERLALSDCSAGDHSLASFARRCVWLAEVTLSGLELPSARGAAELARRARHMRYLGVGGGCARLLAQRAAVEDLFRAHAWAWCRVHFFRDEDEDEDEDDDDDEEGAAGGEEEEEGEVEEEGGVDAAAGGGWTWHQCQ